MTSGHKYQASHRGNQHKRERQSKAEEKSKKDVAKGERQSQWDNTESQFDGASKTPTGAETPTTQGKAENAPGHSTVPLATVQKPSPPAPCAADHIEATQSIPISIGDSLSPVFTSNSEPIQDSPSQPETATKEEVGTGNVEKASVDENAPSTGDTGEDFSALSSPEKPTSREMPDILAMAEKYKLKYLSEIAAERVNSQNKPDAQNVDSIVRNVRVASTQPSTTTQKPRQLSPFATRAKRIHLSKRSIVVGGTVRSSPAVGGIASTTSQASRSYMDSANGAQLPRASKRARIGNVPAGSKINASRESTEVAPSGFVEHAKTSPTRVVAVKRTTRVPGQGNIYEDDKLSQDWSSFMRNPRMWLRRLLASTYGSLRQISGAVSRICGRKRSAEEASLDVTDDVPETQHVHALEAPMPAFRDAKEAKKARDRAFKESQALARIKQLDDEAELERQREAEDKAFIKWRLREMVKYLKQSTQRRNAVKARQEEDAISSKMQATEVSDDDFDYLADLLGTSMNEEELLYLLKCAEDGVLPIIELSAQNIHKAWALLQNQNFAAKEPALQAHLCLHMAPVLERLQFKLFASTLHALNLFDEELMVMYHSLSGQATFDFAVTPATAARAQYLSFHPLIRDQYPRLAMAIEAKARFAVSVLQQSDSMDVDMSIESPAAVATRNNTLNPTTVVQSVLWTPLAMDGVITDAAGDESLANSPERLATSNAFSSSTTVAAHQLTAMSDSPMQTTGALRAVTSSEKSLNAPMTSSSNAQASANRVVADTSISLRAKEGTLRLKLERIRDQVEPQVGNALKSNNGPAYQAAVLSMTKDLIEARNFANGFNSSSFDKFLDEQDPCEDTGVPRKQFWVGGGHLKDYENKEKTLKAKMQYIRTQLEPELATPWAAGDMATAAPLIAKMTNALIEAKNIANLLGSSTIDDFLKEQDPIDPDSNPREDFWAERVYGV